PEELRALIGNRVYGCDDCQAVCPWNRFARISEEKDFAVRNGLDRATLVELFAWSEAEFDERMRGSAIRRIGYERCLRNRAVARRCALPPWLLRLFLPAPHGRALRRGRLRFFRARPAQVWPFAAAAPAPEFLQGRRGVLRRHHGSDRRDRRAGAARRPFDRGAGGLALCARRRASRRAEGAVAEQPLLRLAFARLAARAASPCRGARPVLAL